MKLLTKLANNNFSLERHQLLSEFESDKTRLTAQYGQQNDALNNRIKLIESQRAIEAEANEAALETLKAQHEERASVMLLSSEAGEAELKAQADRLQTCLGGLRSAFVIGSEGNWVAYSG